MVVSACSPAVPIAMPGTDGLSKARLIFDQGGFYQLTSDIFKRQGLQVDSLTELALFYQAESYPFWFSQGASVDQFSLFFYVPVTNDRYMSQQVMILDTKAAVGVQLLADQLPEISNASAAVPAYGVSLLNFEENHEYQPKAGLEDPFEWAKIEEKKAFEFNAALEDKNVVPGVMLLTFWSPSSAPADPDHGIRVLNDGIDWGEFDWEGSGEHTVEIKLTDDVIQKGINLEVSTTNPANVIAQLVYLNNITIATQMALKLADQENRIEGNDQLWQVGPSEENGFLVEQGNDLYAPLWMEIKQGQTIHIEGKQGCTYTWLPQNAISANFQIQPYKWKDDLTTDDHAADWLVIAPADYSQTLEPLLEQRKSQGLQTLFVDPQQIYDQFYSGLPHPQALTRFFTEIKNSWSLSPKYVLFVGDFSYLPQKYNEALQGIPSAFIPSELIGETVSDLPLVDIDEDRKPDFSIGRVPAQNAEMLAIWVDKVIASEKSWGAIKERTFLTISDGQEAYFANDARQFLAQFTANFQTKALDITKGDQDAGAELIAAVSPSTYLIAYFGHGSIDTWGKDQILNAKIIDQLPKNSNLPIYMNMTCLSGYFIHPQQQSLAEMLLFKKSSGAVIVVAPTSLTTAANQKVLTDNFAKQFQVKTNPRIGDVMLNTWQNLDSSNDTTYVVMSTFMLFGDPAIPIN